MGLLSNLFDPGRNDRDRAQEFAERGVVTGGTIKGPGGISAGFDFSGGQGSLTSSLGSFAPLLEQSQQLSAGGFAQAAGGLPSGLTGQGADTIGRLGQVNVNQLTNESGFAGLGNVFQSALGTAQADPFDLGADISSRLRSLSERRNQRLVNSTFDRLKSTGNLGSSAGIARAGDLERNLQEQGLQFDLAGLQAGRGLQQDAFGRLMGATQGREGIGARQFGESFGLEQLGGNRALQQFGVSSDMFQQFLQNQQQGANIGLAGAQGAANLSQLPLAFMQALGAQQGQASNSLFAAAGVNQQNAAMAKSPFLEALTAAGQVAAGIG